MTATDWFLSASRLTRIALKVPDIGLSPCALAAAACSGRSRVPTVPRSFGEGQSCERPASARALRQTNNSSISTSTAPTLISASARLNTANDQTGVWNRM